MVEAVHAGLAGQVRFRVGGRGERMARELRWLFQYKCCIESSNHTFFFN